MNSQEYAEENPTITYREAKRLVEGHGLTLGEYLDDTVESFTGSRETFNTKALLIWLRY